MSLIDDNVSPITGNRMLPRRMPTAKEANPGCWAMDGNYLGATPLTWWEGCQVGSLVYFSDDARFVIGMAVLHEWTPPVWIECTAASIPSRAWFEWNWYRGIDPFLRRESIPRWMRQAVLERDGLVCGLCGGDVEPNDVHMDHITPVTLGGLNEVDNLQVAHSRCNVRKGNRV